MEPDIEIWDLDTLDVLEPTMILGGPRDSDRGRPLQLEDGGGKQKRKLKKGSHKNSVLSLAWNSTVQNVLASGSADKTIKVCTFTLTCVEKNKLFASFVTSITIPSTAVFLYIYNRVGTQQWLSACCAQLALMNLPRISLLLCGTDTTKIEYLWI